jgi:hypothetical protein
MVNRKNLPIHLELSHIQSVEGRTNAVFQCYI